MAPFLTISASRLKLASARCRLALRLQEVRLGAVQRGLGLSDRRFVDRRVDHGQYGVLLHLVIEINTYLLDGAGNEGPHLHAQHRLHGARGIDQLAPLRRGGPAWCGTAGAAEKAPIVLVGPAASDGQAGKDNDPKQESFHAWASS